MQDFVSLKQLMLIEELLSCLPDKLTMVLAAGKRLYKDDHELAILAEEHETINRIPYCNYNMAHKAFTFRQ